MLAFLTFLLAGISVGAIEVTGKADNPSFMLISGVSAPAEMCLSVESGNVDVVGAAIVLESCSKAIAAGDGRELWQNAPNGQITNVVSKKCIGLGTNDVENGGNVLLTSCDQASAAGQGGSQWEAQGNGQLRLVGAGQYCLSQKGPAAGARDVAALSAISASSSADPEAHGANKAVDGSSNTFWASALDPVEPVTITLDLGGQHKLQTLDIDWEFPPKSFAVGLSVDGVKWTEAFATNSNVLMSTTLPMGSAHAAKIRVVMHETHALYGVFKGHTLFGVSNLRVIAASMQSIVEDCAIAAKSKDARDKYFQSYVGDYGLCSSSSLRSEVPSLEAARVSVASAVSELLDVLPKLASCRRNEILLNTGVPAGDAILSRTNVRSQTASMAVASQILKDVDVKNSIQTDAVNALMKEARRAVIAARGALF